MCSAPRARYVRDSEDTAHTCELLAVHICFCKEGGEFRRTAENTSGHELGSLRVNDSDCACYLQQALAHLYGVSSLSLHVVLPDGQILGSLDPSMGHWGTFGVTRVMPKSFQGRSWDEEIMFLFYIKKTNKCCPTDAFFRVSTI